MSTITKKDMVESIMEEVSQLRKMEIKQRDVQNVIQELLNMIRDELAKGNRLEFREFGIFSVHESPERMAQNPATLEKVPVPRRFNVRFKPGQKMKQKITKVSTLEKSSSVDGNSPT